MVYLSDKQWKAKKQRDREKLVASYLDNNEGIDNKFDNKHCDDYNVYLRSKKWEDKKKHIIKTYGGKCEICDSTSILQVHHNTYKNRGVELDDELTLLCKDCHETYHFKDKTGHRSNNPAKPKNNFTEDICGQLYDGYNRNTKPRYLSGCSHCSLCSHESTHSVKKDIRLLMLCNACREKFKHKLDSLVTEEGACEELWHVKEEKRKLKKRLANNKDKAEKAKARQQELTLEYRARLAKQDGKHEFISRSKKLTIIRRTKKEGGQK